MVVLLLVHLSNSILLLPVATNLECEGRLTYTDLPLFPRYKENMKERGEPLLERTEVQKMHKFTENVKYNEGYMSIGTSTTSTVQTGTSVDMAKYNNFAAIIQGVVTAGAGPLTAYIRESTDAAAWTAAYLSTTTIASATTPYLGYGGVVELRAEQMSDGYRYLRVEVIPQSGTGNLISIANLRFNSRYPQATLPA